MRILKFGGSSVATESRRRRVAEVVHRARRLGGPLVAVTSALGGVTDLLVASIDEAVATGELPVDRLHPLASRHRGAAEALSGAEHQQLDDLLAELNQRLLGIALLGECPPAVRHQILATGERLAVPLVAEALRRRGLEVECLDGAELLVTSAGFGFEPRVDLEASRSLVARRRPEIEHHPGVVLVPGFVAADAAGRTTTLGRGASDLTATLLGELLEAEAVEIWSDVDGVLSGPPSWVPEARPLDRLGYSMAADLARFGARVLHPRTLDPVRRWGIPVSIRNTLRPDGPGTRIDGGGETEGGGCHNLAIAAVEDVCRLRLSAPSPCQGPGFFPPGEAPPGDPLLWVGAMDPGALGPVVRQAEETAWADWAERRGLQIESRTGLALVAVVSDREEGRARLGGSVLGSLDRIGVSPLAVTCSEMTSRGTTLALLVEGTQARRVVEALHADLVAAADDPMLIQSPPRSAQIKHEPAMRAL